MTNIIIRLPFKTSLKTAKKAVNDIRQMIEDDEKYSIYDYQYNVIYNYVSERNLDGLLVSVGTVGSYISREEMAQFLHSYDPLPLLTMEVEFPGYPCIRFNTNAMKLAVEHLIHHHGCRKIGFVSGPMGNQDAMERLQCYRAVLEENHIPYDCTKVVYGNFSEASEEVARNCGCAAGRRTTLCRSAHSR